MKGEIPSSVRTVATAIMAEALDVNNEGNVFIFVRYSGHVNLLEVDANPGDQKYDGRNHVRLLHERIYLDSDGAYDALEQLFERIHKFRNQLEPPKMKMFVTFGQDHVHRVNGKLFDKDCVAVLECNSHEEGREKAFEYFGPKFCTTYTNLDHVGMEYYPRGLIAVEEHGLQAADG